VKKGKAEKMKKINRIKWYFCFF